MTATTVGEHRLGSGGAAPSDGATGDLVSRLMVAVVAAATLVAGLVHATAAGSHSGARTLALLFTYTAVVQIALAGAIAARPHAATLAVAAAVNMLVVAAWATTRVTGVGFIAGLEETQPVGLADATATGLEAVAIAAALVALVRRDLATGIPRWWAAAFSVIALLAAVPGMTAPHEHPVAGHTGHAGPDRPNVVLGIALPDVAGVTAEQKLRAARLIKTTREALPKYSSPQAAEAAGFRSIGDGATGYEHFVNREFAANATVLDPNEPESLVFKVKPGGPKLLVSAMYILPPGHTMADVPDVAGPMTQWHDHQNLCWDATGTRLRGILVNGKCSPGGTFRATPPMLHVWLTEHPCGPFAGIEGGGHTGACHQH